MTALPTINLPIIEPKLNRLKVKVSPQLLPMFATICPVDIVGSDACDDGNVVLILQGAKLPKGEWGTIFCEAKGASSIVTIKAING